MQHRWVRCCACGAVTDFDEHRCPVSCANNGRMESISPSLEEMEKLLLQKNVWTKWPDQLTPFYKKLGLL